MLSGILTAVLANNWLDDSESSSCHLCLLGGYFDLVLQSCRSQGHRVPEASIFKSALEQLRVEPEQVSYEDTKLWFSQIYAVWIVDSQMWFLPGSVRLCGWTLTRVA